MGSIGAASVCIKNGSAFLRVAFLRANTSESQRTRAHLQFAMHKHCSLSNYGHSSLLSQRLGSLLKYYSRAAWLFLPHGNRCYNSGETRYSDGDARFSAALWRRNLPSRWFPEARNSYPG
jgi:hypothetical protein